FRAVCHQLSLENSPCPRRRKKEGEEEEDEDKYEGLSLLTVRHPESWSVDTLRDRVASFLEEHRDNFQPFLDYSAQSDEGFSAYCEKLRHTAEWGGELELQIIARLLKRHLLVYQMNGDLFLPLHYGEEFANGGAGKQARKEEEEDEEEDQREPLRLSFHKHLLSAGGHYNSVVSLLTEQQEEEEDS
ncbi:otu family cysteine protease, partial [Cystoisospora suis]